jgi:hypothetical protein
LVVARCRTFACAVAEPLVAGDLRAALPGLEEGLRCSVEVRLFQRHLIEHVFGQGQIHERTP